VTENFLRLNFTTKAGVTAGTNDTLGMDCDQIRARYAVSVFGVSTTGPRIPGQIEVSTALGCSEGQSFNGGYSALPRVYSINFGANAGLYVLGFQFRNIPDKMEVYQAGNIKATTAVEVGGGSVAVQTFMPDKLPLRFRYDPALGREGEIKVYTSAANTIWYWIQSCPAVSLIDTVYTFNNMNYSLLFEGLTANTNYKILFEAVSGTSQIKFYIWNAAHALTAPLLPLFSGLTLGLPVTYTFDSGTVAAIVLDVEMDTNNTEYRITFSLA